METQANRHDLTVNINKTTCCYDDMGEGNVPIIFIHGFPFDKTMWQPQIDFFKATKRVIAYDIRGFGKSTDKETPVSIDLFADDLIQFMNALKIDKAVVCGLSMGGFIALNALKRFPEHFAALALCDTQCIADTADVKEKRYERIKQIQHNGITDFSEEFVKIIFHKNSFADKKELVGKIRSVVLSNSKKTVTKGLVALAERSETCSSLGAITIPTLIICGREDEVTPLTESEFMNEHIKGATLRIIDNAGHVSNLEQPDEFNKHLQNFLTELIPVAAKGLESVKNNSGVQNPVIL